MNWSSLIFGLVLIFSLVFYFFKKRHEYLGPVAAIRDTEMEHAVDLDDLKK
jgi:choline transport protein